jgi:hypothetical protein
MSLCGIGAIDVSVVQNFSQIVWNEVVPFSPVGTQTNTSGYFFWAIQMSGFGVRHLLSHPWCIMTLTSCKVNGTEYTPQPTYPVPSGNSSIALLDVYVVHDVSMCCAEVSHSGTPGLYGPYQDVRTRFSCSMAHLYILLGNTTIWLISK